MSDPRWTDETFAGALMEAFPGLPECMTVDEARRRIRKVLIYLADAGLLVEPGNEVYEEWGVRYPNLHPEPVWCSDEAVARHTAEGVGRTLMRRTIYAGPWVEAS